MVRLLDGGGLDARILNDPRMTAAQRVAMMDIARVDPEASILGLDAKLRPVISANLEGPGRTVYALLRNGAPAKLVRPMAETWRKRRGRPANS